MRIVSLEPFITELIISLGRAEDLVGISASCPAGDKPGVERVTDSAKLSRSSATISGLALEDCLNRFQADFVKIKSLKPDLILTMLPFDRAGKELEEALSKALSERLGFSVLVRSISPITFDFVLEGYEKVGALIGARDKALDIAHRVRAQVMSWIDNFYERMKNKRVTFVSSVVPLSLGGRWIADVIKLCSAISQTNSIDLREPTVEWEEIAAFKPDVLIVSPQGMDLKQSLGCFKAFERLPEWETLPAVKRGEVVFVEGQKYFHSSGANFLDSIAILISAIAGFESGYITPRDSYFRLRWMEMQRHKY